MIGRFEAICNVHLDFIYFIYTRYIHRVSERLPVYFGTVQSKNERILTNRILKKPDIRKM